MNREEFENCINKLNEIKTLKDNWNDNGASAFSEELINKVKKFINYNIYTPEIFPTAANSIQLEYENQHKEYLELEFKEEKIELFKIDKNNNETTLMFSYNEIFKIINIIKIFFNENLENAVLFTGAFNPPTIAHYHMIQSVLENKQKEFNYVIFALSNDKFLSKKQAKQKDWYYNEQERLQMILEMTAQNPNVLIYGIENGYTYEVLNATQKEFGCKNLYFACGSDKLNEINRWGFHDKLLKEFGFYILLRTDDENDARKKCENLFKDTYYILGRDNEKYKNISATLVRQKIKNNENFDDLLEPNVSNYIREKLNDN